jgi:hypothetical protein
MLKPLLSRLNALMADRAGFRVVSTAVLHPWQVSPWFGGSHSQEGLPEGARGYLRPDNPRLIDLKQRYAHFDPRATQPQVWTSQWLRPEDLLYFRGDNAFIWQVRGLNRNELSYTLCYYELKAADQDGLLVRLGEDNAFGIHLFKIDGRSVSRDLLDSVREIQFLRRHVGIGDGTWNILDIGAGYGRLAHRLSEAGGDVQVFATDAYAPSTFICEYYLRHRHAERAHVTPLDEVEALLAGGDIQLAINVHSFSECTLDAVDWWTQKIAAYRVRYLFIVPNAGASGGARCQTFDGRELEPIFARHRYHPIVREPRYADPIVQKYGIDPVWLHLFEQR